MQTKNIRNYVRLTSLAFSLFSLFTMASVGYANEGEGGHHHHFKRAVPYLSSSQLTSLAALNLSDAQWKCFWRGVRKADFQAAMKTVGVTQGQKPTDEQRSALKSALKSGFSAAFTAQLSVAPTNSCPFTKPN